ncbi:MAG: phosphate ABC transporter substrate-binding protein PstS [Porphyromonas sp.]|nr:phosphate ABC transporter substrate-binding protein PstS [Porphyromonas sp.]
MFQKNMRALPSIISLVVTLLLASSCGRDNVILSGAGATFPAPFYSDATKLYDQLSGIKISYGAMGSGAGIRNLEEHTVDFGGTDVFMSDSEMAEMPAEVLHIPTCIGGVVLSYNLDDVPVLNLTPDLVTDIFLGNITNWNDPALAEANPDVILPDQPITVVYRSEGSGTTAVFTGFMSQVSTEWDEAIGAGKSVNFPVGIAAKGNPGVAGVIGQTVGSIGYLGSEYALAMDIVSARMQNRAGKFVEANLETIKLSADKDLPDDTRAIISNPTHPDAYPISTMTWVIVYKEQNYYGRSLRHVQELQKFLLFLVGEEGARSASKTHYVPLPLSARKKAEAVIKSMTYNGEPLWAADPTEVEKNITSEINEG